WVPPLKSLQAQFLASPVTVRGQPAGDPGCFIARPTVPASCDRLSRTARWEVRETATYLGRHPVLPYLLNGGGVAFQPSSGGLYLSRLLTTMVAAALLASSVALAVTRRRAFLLLGLIIVATPSMLAGFGVLSSSPLEITTSILAFVIIALFAEDEPMTPRLVVVLAASLAALALSRPISFLWAGLAGLTMLVLLPWRNLAALFRRRSVKAAAVLLGLALVVSLAWYFFLSADPDPSYDPFLSRARLPGEQGAGTLGTQLEYYRQHPLARLAQLVLLIPVFWQQSLGAIGFNEYAGPWALHLGWSAVTAIVVGMGALFSSRRRVLLLVLFFIVVLVLPVVVQFAYFLQTGPFWQGRYNLPIQAAIVILAVAILDRVRTRVPELRRILLPAVGFCGVLHLLAFYGGLRRYVVGTGGPLSPPEWGAGWQPPLPPVSLLVLMAVVLGITYGLAAVTLRILAPPDYATVDGEPLLARPQIPVVR
ncbi:MAG: DUF2142 domain-containing protein, partial [Actinomycetota bacterium]|nr:DUF2142 domain-containing protein [Actinomycetota bacterium]